MGGFCLGRVKIWSVEVDSIQEHTKLHLWVWKETNGRIKFKDSSKIYQIKMASLENLFVVCEPFTSLQYIHQGGWT